MAPNQLITSPPKLHSGLPEGYPGPLLALVPDARSSQVRCPGWDDPRIPFAGLLTLYAVLGLTVLGFNRSPAQMATIVVTGCALDLVLARVLRGFWQVPLSAYITSCSLALLLNYSHSSPILFVPIYLAIGSKYVLTFDERHVFNPSMFAVAVSLLISGELITAAPAYQWMGGWGGGLALSAFLVTAATLVFMRRLGRSLLVGSFLGLYALQTVLRAYFMRYHLPPATLFLGTMTAPSFFVFSFYMITDPATSPRSRVGQVMLAVAITVVDLGLHLKQSVYTLFYAAFACATARFLYLHGRAVLTRGRAYWFGLLSPEKLRRFGVVAGLGCVLLGGLALTSVQPLGRDPGFHMERLTPEQTGIHVQLDNLFQQVDPRLQHIAKWILSVGDAVAVGDFDGDGQLDLFLTNVLKGPADRGALYRNLGNFRFERVPLPAMDAINAHFPESGLPSGATFVDYDGDGDEDLIVAMSFGPSRVFKNMLVETGHPDFVDVTNLVGLTEQTISLAVTAFDFDRDGILDLFVTNAASPWLRDYPTPTPLNAFSLPAPEYPGDRRMFHFMHDSWHNAENGGLNALYKGKADGTFEKLDVAAMGMPETHWSLAVGTADLNRDGFTDLYVANDFGADDVYLNEGGKHFRRVAGRTFGEIGRDTYKGMNVSIADFDRNGWLDVYVSNVHHALQAEGSLLWMVYPGAHPFVPRFSDEATSRGALNEHRFGWGAASGDLDLDGWPDIVQANGMVDDRLDHLYKGDKDYWYLNHKLMQAGPSIHTYADKWGDLRGRTIYPNEPRRAYLNRGDSAPGEFVDVAKEIGIADPDNSRGVLLADLDNDGDLDLVITNQHGAPSIYRNTLRTPGKGNGKANFLGLKLTGDGVHTNRAAIGTRVEARYFLHGKPVEQVREVGLLGGFSAQADPRLLFGLGEFNGPVEVTIRWYGAAAQTLVLTPDRYYTIRQGEISR